jgi:hypothetical protein
MRQPSIRLRAFALPMLALLAATPGARAVEVLIPSYFYPSVTNANNPWTQLNTAASSVALTAILNPASGPGDVLDTSYLNAVKSLRASGGRVIGYVSTSYAARPIADVKADIAAYAARYPLDGIFLDEMTNTNDAAALAYYTELRSYIRTTNPNWRVTGNPGTSTTPAYLTAPAADTLVTYEGFSGYTSSDATPLPWTASYGTRRFSNLNYRVPATSLVSTIDAAISKRAGYIYVTDDGNPTDSDGGNPWNALPTYWTAEIAAIRARTPTWANAGSGDWSAPGNWTTSSSPNGVGAEALLFGGINSAQTVYTNTNVTLGALVFNNANRYVVTGAGTLTMDAAIEGSLIDVRRGSHSINLPLTLTDATTAYLAPGTTLSIDDPLNFSPGSSLTKLGEGTLTVNSITTTGAAALSVAAGTLNIDAPAQLQTLTIAEGATLTLGSGALIGGTVDSATIRASLGAAYDRGAWDGSGIRPSREDAMSAIGYAHFTEIGSPETLFGLDANPYDFALVVTRVGDANLDGTVDISDLLRLLASTGTTNDAATWSNGDFDYDGQVNAHDLMMIEAGYSNPAAFATDLRLASSLVPEPAAAATLFLFAAFHRSRRTRRDG